MKLPYLPEGREIKTVPVDHPLMQEAKRARAELAGDPLWPNGAVLVRDGKVVMCAGNGFNTADTSPHVCPRIVENCKSGEGYELCQLHDPSGHAEAMLMKEAKKAGVDTEGADVYMYGHWWCCQPCWDAMIKGGVRDVYVTDDAQERFTKDRVYGETMKMTVKRVFLSAALTWLGDDAELCKNFYERIGDACGEVGVECHIPHLHTGPERNPDAADRDVFWLNMQAVEVSDAVLSVVDHPSHGTGGELVFAQQKKVPIVLLSKKGVRVSRFVTGNPAVAYRLEYETQEEALEKLPRILRML